MEALANFLPHLNACLNASSAALLLCGYWAIRTQRRQLHKRLMVGAFASSSVFLAGYLTRFALTGAHRFEGPPLLRGIYLAILVTHMILAIAIVPMILRTLYLAYRERLLEHRKLAKVTFPMWLYVSVTGVIVYFMLYHLSQ